MLCRLCTALALGGAPATDASAPATDASVPASDGSAVTLPPPRVAPGDAPPPAPRRTAAAPPASAPSAAPPPLREPASAVPPGTRGSLRRRGNDAILRSRGPVFSLAAAPRLGVLLVGGAQVMQPVGFGAGLQLRVHALRLGPLRIGGELQLGHTRYLERWSVPTPAGGRARRFAALGHSDFALGPSFQLLMGPIFAEIGVAAGLGVSTLVRPLGPFVSDEQDISDTSAMIRAGGHLGVPVRNNSSIIIGAALHKYFSRKQVVARPDPEQPDARPDTNPFDMMVEIIVGYHYMF